jgi:alpha-ketoglutarate-dependent 2,4-dichlorophenoxyacetate dioxygenase
MDGPEKVSAVTNVTGDGQVCSSDDTHLFHLKSNMLWHTDSTFLPVPALANVLQAQVVPSEGGATEFVSTRVGFRNFKLGKQEQLRNTFFHHRYSHSRARIDPELARRDMFTMWPDQAWRAAWTNPVNGEESVHIASHAFAVDGMNEANGTAFIDSLINEVTQPDTIYSHYWEPGDVLVWDERAMLHRGTPWPYDRPRTLVSTCVSARDIDGLASVWPN